MARYTGPKLRFSRREGGADLGLKSARRTLSSKCKLDTKPGQHGRSSGSRQSDYSLQQREKQKTRRTYGVLETQFRRYFKNARKKKGGTGDNLLRILEERLDNVVYRMGFASTRAEARQLVSHCGVLLKGKICNIPSAPVRAGEEVAIAEKAKGQKRIQEALMLAEQAGLPEWVTLNKAALSGVFKGLPAENTWSADIKSDLIVEYYSR